MDSALKIVECLTLLRWSFMALVGLEILYAIAKNLAGDEDDEDEEDEDVPSDDAYSALRQPSLN